MGGATAGNIASQAAIELVKSFLEDHRSDIAAFESGKNTRQDMLNLLEKAVQQASQAVFTMGLEQRPAPRNGHHSFVAAAYKEAWFHRACWE